MRKHMLSLIIITLLVGQSEAITLKEAIRTALKKNNELKAKSYEVKEVEKQLLISKLHLLPSIRIYEKYNKTTDPPYAIMNRMETQELAMAETDFNKPGRSEVFTTGVETTLPIWMGGKIRTGINISKKELEATKEQFELTKDKVVLEVAKAYYNVLTAKAFVKTAELALKDANRHLKDAELVYRSGLGVKSDYLRAKVFVKQSEENLIKAKSNLEIAKKALNIAMGLSPSSWISIDGDLIFRPVNIDLKTAIKTAMSNRKEIKELSCRLEQAEYMKKLAISDFLPKIYAFSDYHFSSDEKMLGREASNWTTGIQAEVNIFSGGTKFVRIRKAKLTKLRIKEYISRVKKGIEFEVTRDFLKMKEAEKRVELARASLEEAQESLRIVEKRYNNGLANITELLDTQTSLNIARTNYIKAVSDYKISLINLMYSEGILSKSYYNLPE